MEDLKMMLKDYWDGKNNIKSIDELIIKMKNDKEFTKLRGNVSIIEYYKENDTQDAVNLKDEQFYETRMSGFDL